MDKTILLASFISPERINWFLTYLESDFQLTKNKVFCYKNTDDESKVIFTFKIQIPSGKHLNLKTLFPNTIPVHKKGNAIYTINALNKLIEQTLGIGNGNIDHKSHVIDWNEYQNKIILVNSKKLVISNISRVF